MVQSKNLEVWFPQVKQDFEIETDIQVGKTVTRAPCYMRTQLWLGVLQRYPGMGHKAARQYNSLLRKVRLILCSQS